MATSMCVRQALSALTHCPLKGGWNGFYLTAWIILRVPNLLGIVLLEGFLSRFQTLIGKAVGILSYYHFVVVIHVLKQCLQKLSLNWARRGFWLFWEGVTLWPLHPKRIQLTLCPPFEQLWALSCPAPRYPVGAGKVRFCLTNCENH